MTKPCAILSFFVHFLKQACSIDVRISDYVHVRRWWLLIVYAESPWSVYELHFKKSIDCQSWRHRLMCSCRIMFCRLDRWHHNIWMQILAPIKRLRLMYNLWNALLWSCRALVSTFYNISVLVCRGGRLDWLTAQPAKTYRKYRKGHEWNLEVLV